MTILTFPLSRIEGHAQVVIEVDGGEVLSARFQATEFRGFEYFVQGVPAEQMPVIVPRICGVCSTAHHIASVKALEDAYGVKPPPLPSRSVNYSSWANSSRTRPHPSLSSPCRTVSELRVSLIIQMIRSWKKFEPELDHGRSKCGRQALI